MVFLTGDARKQCGLKGGMRTLTSWWIILPCRLWNGIQERVCRLTRHDRRNP